jgi:thymidylate synthase (FAD)
MKLIEPSVELIEQEPGIEGIYKQIEWVGRHCYMSMDKITEDSAKKFVDMLIKNGHGAMLEHGTVYMEVPIEHWREDEHEWVYMFPDRCPWVSLDCDGDWMYITTNFRHILNGDVGETLMKQYMCEPTKNHEKRYTLKFITSIGITRELIRHRHFSFANESTRYVNYRNKGLVFIKPYWYDKFS